MTTITVHHTFTTTIASPPPHAPGGPSHPPRVDVVVAAVAPPVGTSTDGTRRRISRRAIDRSRARRTRRRIRIRISTHVASRRRRPRSSAFGRVIALHSRLARIRSNARAHSSRATSAEGIRASREVVFERASEGETRARCDARTRRARGENGDAGRTGRTGRTLFARERENEFQFK